MDDTLYNMFFKAFANKTRLEIINLLKAGPLTVTEISKKLNFEQSRVSHNLRHLEISGFITVEKHGKWKKYSLNKKTILPIVKLYDTHIKKYRKGLESNKENLKQILKHMDLALQGDHTCGCAPCTELPQLVLTESSLRDKHNCNCSACIDNFNAILGAESAVIEIREDHHCTCKACQENQRKLAQL